MQDYFKPGMHSPATMHSILKRMPQILIIHFKRDINLLQSILIILMHFDVTNIMFSLLIELFMDNDASLRAFLIYFCLIVMLVGRSINVCCFFHRLTTACLIRTKTFTLLFADLCLKLSMLSSF